MTDEASREKVLSARGAEMGAGPGLSTREGRATKDALKVVSGKCHVLHSKRGFQKGVLSTIQVRRDDV